MYIVMDFIEHDLKSLLAVMRNTLTFLQSEINTLLLQLLSVVTKAGSCVEISRRPTF